MGLCKADATPEFGVLPTVTYQDPALPSFSPPACIPRGASPPGVLAPREHPRSLGEYLATVGMRLLDSDTPADEAYTFFCVGPGALACLGQPQGPRAGRASPT